MKRERDDEEDRGVPPPLVPGEQPPKQPKMERGQTPHGANKMHLQQPPYSHLDGHGHHQGRGGDQVIDSATLGTPKAPPAVNSAFDYLSQVKQKCPPSVTGELFRVLRDYKSARLSRRQVITAVSELLEGHDDLIEGFNSFLPSNEKIDKQAEASQEDDEDEEDEDDEDGDDEQRKVRSTGGGGRGSTTNELANAKNFIERARQRFENQPEVYKTFISLLREFHEKKGYMTIKVLYKKIVSLFQGHPDLVAGIQSFLPDPVESEGSDDGRQSQAKQRKQKMGRKAPARSSSRKEKDKAAKKASQPLAADHNNHVKHREEKGASYTVVSDDLNLFFAIKKKLDNQNYFLELLKCLNLFNSKIITRVQLMLLVVDILGRFPELLQRFKGFVRFSVPEEKELMEQLHALYEADLDKSEARQRRRANNVKFELQTLIIEANLAVAQLGQILSEISELSEEVLIDLKFDVGRLDGPCVRSLERLYSERTRDVLRTIQDNPIITVPIVLKRLKQKESEWKSLSLRYGTSADEPATTTATTTTVNGTGESEMKPVVINGEVNGEIVNKSAESTKKEEEVVSQQQQQQQQPQQPNEDRGSSSSTSSPSSLAVSEEGGKAEECIEAGSLANGDSKKAGAADEKMDVDEAEAEHKHSGEDDDSSSSKDDADKEGGDHSKDTVATTSDNMEVEDSSAPAEGGAVDSHKEETQKEAEEERPKQDDEHDAKKEDKEETKKTGDEEDEEEEEKEQGQKMMDTPEAGDNIDSNGEKDTSFAQSTPSDPAEDQGDRFGAETAESGMLC